MRLAVLIVGLVLSAGLFALAVVSYTASDIFSEETAEQSAAVGILIACLWLLGSAFAIGLPRVALVLFALAALAGFLGVAIDTDLAIWGTVSAILTAGSYLGHREKRTLDGKQRERDSLLLALVLATKAPPAPIMADHRAAYETWAVRA